MHQRRLAALLLHPSIFSMVLTTMLAIAILGVSLWPSVVKDPSIGQFLYGPYGAITAIQKSPDITSFTAAFSVSPLIYSLLIFAIAVLIALGVYAILQSISKIIVGSYDTWHAIHDAGPAVDNVEKEIGTRLTIRLMSLLLWIAFIFVFWSLFLPYCVFAARIAIADPFNWEVLYGLVGLIALIASLHLHVIFLRLIVLRPRVFGGKLDILEAIYEADDHMQ